MAFRPAIALASYLAAQKLGARARAERRLSREIAAHRESGERGPERLGVTPIARPDAPLVWIHVGNETEAMGIPEVVDRLHEERDDLAVLISTARHGPDELFASRLPPDVILQHAPYDIGPGAIAFLEHWRPDVAVWADNSLNPGLIEATHAASVPLFLVDARVPERPGWRWLPGLRRALLRRFTHVLAGDKRAAAGLAALGVPAGRIEATGFLQEGTAPLPCSQAERDSLAEILAARPVWLVAGATPKEARRVADVHRNAIRRSHRLLLVIVPDDEANGPTLAEWLEGEGWVTGLRSRDDDPEPDVEVFVADLPDELGLWYRLSPLALIGGTLGGDGPVRNPYEAAALGSAVLFGPHTGMWRESFERLHEVGAARAVNGVADLTLAVETLLAPDKVAAMAAAAWEVTTSGAEATDRVVDLVMDALDAQGV